MGLMVGASILGLLILYVGVENHDTFFVLAELSHFVGLGVLIYSLVTKRNCGGLSLRSQELTALFLAIR